MKMVDLYSYNSPKDHRKEKVATVVSSNDYSRVLLGNGGEALWGFGLISH